MSPISYRRVLLKALLLFLAANLLFSPLSRPGRGAGGEGLGVNASLYNRLFPGRERLPYGDRPELAYNLSLFDLDAMFASHAIALGPKPAGEYRILLLGDSSVWGFLLEPQDTLSAYLNAAGLAAPDGRQVRVYNLGYPTMSLTKDLLLLGQALAYQAEPGSAPDLIIWLVTLESMPRSKQLSSPIVQHNPQAVRRLIETYALGLDPADPAFVTPTFWDRTLVGQRRALADRLRLQLYGVLWAATGIDQYYPPSYDPPQSDLEADQCFQGLLPPVLQPSDLALEVLQAGVQMAAPVPVLIVNEPVYISQGQNSDIRYNFFYPRWAYDQYRLLLAETCQQNGWACLDAWDLVPPGEYTNSAIHLTPAGESLLAERISEVLFK